MKKKKDKPALAERITKAIKDAGMENEDIAPKVGYETGGGVGLWRAGLRPPSLRQLELLAEATGCSLYWLVTGKEEPPPVEEAVKKRLDQFLTEVVAGADPIEVWLRLTGSPIKPEAAALLAADPSGLQELLSGPLGEDWRLLDSEERDAIDRLVQLLIRRRSDRS